jgi:NitT/TauT family transport system permease protein
LAPSRLHRAESRYPDPASNLAPDLDSDRHPGSALAIFLRFLASLLPLTVAAMNAVANIPAVHLNAGRNFRSFRDPIARARFLPRVMPQLIIAMRIALGIAWLVVVAAEMIAVNSGLGFLIIDAGY